MSTVISRDGTRIGYEKSGDGQPLVIVDGALCHRKFGPSKGMAELLSRHFTVYRYDRRGRGDSGDTPPYAVEREVDDLEAVVKEAGGAAYLFGMSSGAALALEAAAQLGGSVRKLALYEAPFVVDDSLPPRPDDYIEKMDAMIAAGRNGDAVQTFMRTVGTPGIFVAVMRLTPVWPKLKKVAPTLPYDFRVLGDTGGGRTLPADRWATATMPTLVMDGGKSPAWMRNGMRQLAEVLPDAEYRTLDGQTHMLKAAAVEPVLVEFFNRD